MDLDLDSPPLEALPSLSRVRRLLERRAEAADEVEAEWERLPADARAEMTAPAEACRVTVARATAAATPRVVAARRWVATRGPVAARRREATQRPAAAR